MKVLYSHTKWKLCRKYAFIKCEGEKAVGIHSLAYLGQSKDTHLIIVNGYSPVGFGGHTLHANRFSVPCIPNENGLQVVSMGNGVATAHHSLWPARCAPNPCDTVSIPCRPAWNTGNGELIKILHLSYLLVRSMISETNTGWFGILFAIPRVQCHMHELKRKQLPSSADRCPFSFFDVSSLQGEGLWFWPLNFLRMHWVRDKVKRHQMQHFFFWERFAIPPYHWK